ncbi:MAG: type II toxin-antitoxin system PemK/MazF family toxin [Bacteroidota bacterium]|nr:type II toxin-antitoxin system PemK/MazF family toxin [Bacteroidota bacterium]
MKQQNEIWLINLNPTKGAEIKKTRPAIIVNDNAVGRLPLKIIVPLTDWKDRYEVAPWMVKIEPNKQNKLTKTSSADCFQVRSVSENRFVKKIGKIDNETSEEIKIALAKVLSIKCDDIDIDDE